MYEHRQESVSDCEQAQFILSSLGAVGGTHLGYIKIGIDPCTNTVQIYLDQRNKDQHTFPTKKLQQSP
jgi:hypothetical protein